MAIHENLQEKEQALYPAATDGEIDSGVATTPRTFTAANLKRAAQKHALSLNWTGASAHTPTQKNAAANNLGMMHELSFLFKNGHAGVTLAAGAINTVKLQRLFPNGHTMNHFLQTPFTVYEMYFQFWDQRGVDETGTADGVPGPGIFSFYLGQYDFLTDSVTPLSLSHSFTTDDVISGDTPVLSFGNAAGIGTTLPAGVVIGATLAEDAYNTAVFGIVNLVLRGVFR